MLPMIKQLEAKEIIPLLEQLEECEKTALSDDEMKIILNKIKEKAILLAALLQKELIL